MHALAATSPVAVTAAGPRPSEADVLFFLADLVGAIPTVIMLGILILAILVLWAAFITHHVPQQPSENSAWDWLDKEGRQ